MGGCRKKGRRGPGLALRVRVRESQPEYEARGHAKRRARHPLRMPATTWLAADTHTHLARLWLLLELDRQDMSASEQGRTRSKLRGTREGRALLVSAALSDWLRSAIGNHSNPGERIRSRPFHGRLSAPFLTRCLLSQVIDQPMVELTMSELDSIIQEAGEERDKLRLSVYGLAEPLAHRASHLSLSTRASLCPSLFFRSVFAHLACGRMSPGSARKAVLCSVRFA